MTQVDELQAEINRLRSNCAQAADEVASYRTMSADWQMAVLRAAELQAEINKLNAEKAETIERLRKLVTAFASVDPQPNLHTNCPWCERSKRHESDCPWILANAEVWMDA